MMGSKIENLIVLKENEINVPNFYVISDDEIKNDKFDVLKKLKDKKYAIRSSCSIEDSDNYSFAGQFDTYLNIKREDVKEYVLKCYSSLENENVKDYIKKNHIRAKDVKMNVIIQEMVESELSGILFTSNIKGLLNESIIVVGKGLGEGIVNDKVNTTTYYYNLDDNIYYYEGKKDLLDEKLINKLIDTSIKIKSLLGDYLDIEYGIKNGEVYILQARPITTLSDVNLLIMDNSNIVESYPGISLPMTCSFVDVVYSGVFKGLIRRVLKNDEELENYNEIFNNMVGNVNGRVYYKISNWYELLLILPFSKKIIKIWQEMLGVKNKNVPTSKVKHGILKKFKIFINYFRELKNVSRSMDKLNEDFDKVNELYKAKYSFDMDSKDAIKLYDEIREKLLSFWDITLVNDMYTFIYTALFKRRISKKYKNIELANSYLSGVSNIESLKPIQELINLAYNYDNQDRDFAIDRYIELYGDRSLEELKLESKTFRTNRELLLDQIDYYREDKDKLEEMYKNINSSKKDLPKIDAKSSRILEKCKTGIKNREISRLNRSRIFGMVRSLMLVLGNDFEKNDLIEEQRDIFYLTIDEAFENVKKRKDFKEVIRERKEKYKLYNMLPPYSRLVFSGKEFNKEHVSVNSNKIYLSSDYLKGTGCSSGEVTGEVLVVDNISKTNDVKEKILVTKMTDPGWVFLLANSKGVISEKGSLLSHTAIISRELRVPSIVGVDKLLDTLRDGDIVKMNGDTGDIHILERK